MKNQEGASPDDASERALERLRRLISGFIEEARECGANADQILAFIVRELPDIIEETVQGALDDALPRAADRAAAVSEPDGALGAAVEQILSDFVWGGFPARCCSREHFVVNVCAPDKRGLLARVLKELAANNVGVRTARGARWRGSTAWLSIEVEAPISNPDWPMLWEQLTKISGGTVTLRSETEVAGPHTVCASPPSISTPPHVRVTNNHGAAQTTVEVVAVGRAGLLAAVVEVIVARGHDLVAVEAETNTHQVRDIFDIVEGGSRCQLTDKAAHELETAVLFALASAR